MTDARKHLSKGLMSLIRQTPFYTNLLIRNEIVECDELDSFMATDGKRLIFNSSILQCNTKEMAEILKHEAMHIANKHHIRGKQLEKQYAKIEKYNIDFRIAFNIVADLAINSLLRLIMNQLGKVICLEVDVCLVFLQDLKTFRQQNLRVLL